MVYRERALSVIAVVAVLAGLGGYGLGTVLSPKAEADSIAFGRDDFADESTDRDDPSGADDPLQTAPSSTAPADPETSELGTVVPTTAPISQPPPEPLRVLFAGDSVMAGVHPPFAAADPSTEALEVQFLLTPTVLRDSVVMFSWQRLLADFDPDVVVLLVGTWELGEVTIGRGIDREMDDPEWSEAYASAVLDPWMDLVTEGGASVLWIGAPPTPDPEVNAGFSQLNAAFADLEARWPQLTYLDSGQALGGPEGAFAEFDDGPEPRRRLRQVDGLHLCPAGAAALATAIADHLGPVTESLPAGWLDGEWMLGEEFPPANCPT